MLGSNRSVGQASPTGPLVRQFSGPHSDLIRRALKGIAPQIRSVADRHLAATLGRAIQNEGVTVQTSDLEAIGLAISPTLTPRTLINAILQGDAIFRVPGYQPLADETHRHLLQIAAHMHALAPHCELSIPDALMTGLVHDLGRIVVLGSASRVRRESRGQLLPTAEGIAQLTEAVHTSLGALVAEQWGFASHIVDAVLHHHRPERATDAGRPLAYLVWLAERMVEREPIPNVWYEAFGVQMTDELLAQTRQEAEATLQQA